MRLVAVVTVKNRFESYWLCCLTRMWFKNTLFAIHLSIFTLASINRFLRLAYSCAIETARPLLVTVEISYNIKRLCTKLNLNANALRYKIFTGLRGFKQLSDRRFLNILYLSWAASKFIIKLLQLIKMVWAYISTKIRSRKRMRL